MSRRAGRSPSRGGKMSDPRSNIIPITARRDRANARFHNVELPSWERVADDVCQAMAFGPDAHKFKDIEDEIHATIRDLVRQLAPQVEREGEWAWLVDLGVPHRYVRHCAVVTTLKHVYSTPGSMLELIMAMVEWLDEQEATKPPS